MKFKIIVPFEEQLEVTFKIFNLLIRESLHAREIFQNSLPAKKNLNLASSAKVSVRESLYV